MPTDVKIQYTIPGVTAKDYFRVALEDDALTKRFHAEVNNDPNATVSPWEGGLRSVSFHMTLNVPAMIRKIIGTDHIRVQEVTKITWHSPNCFELSTDPCLDFPGANKFTTSGTTVVADTTEGCQIDCTLRCNAALPWPMQGSVEAVMASEGKATVGRYLEYTKQACEEDRNNRAAAAASPAAPAPAARAEPPPLERVPVSAAAGTVDEEEWYDFEDDGGEHFGPGAVPFRGASAAEAGPLAAYEPLGRDEVAVRCLLQIQRSSAESAALLKQVLAALQAMGADIADIHQAAVQTRTAPGAPAGGRKPASPPAVVVQPAAGASASHAAGANANGTARPPIRPAAASSAATASSSSYASFSYGLLVGLAAASAGAAIYLRAKQRSAGAS